MQGGQFWATIEKKKFKSVGLIYMEDKKLNWAYLNGSYVWLDDHRNADVYTAYHKLAALYRMQLVDKLPEHRIRNTIRRMSCDSTVSIDLY